MAPANPFELAFAQAVLAWQADPELHAQRIDTAQRYAAWASHTAAGKAAHRRGVCVVAVFTKDVAETKATRATDAGRAKGYPLLFTTEPEE